MLVNDAASESTPAIIRAKSVDPFVGDYLDNERVLSPAHPKRADTGVLWMHRHRIRDERLRLPAAAPVLGFALSRSPSAGITGFDSIEFDLGDFHWENCGYKLSKAARVDNGQNDIRRGLFDATRRRTGLVAKACRAGSAVE